MKTPNIYLFILTVGIFGGTACNQGHPLSNSELTAEADTTLVGPTWQLVAFLEADGDRILVENLPEWGRGYTVTFTKQNLKCNSSKSPCGKWHMKVQGHPNEGFFTYDIGSDGNQSLTIYFHGQTKMGQPDGSKENMFFNALKAAKSYRINGKQLRIFYSDEKVLLFEPAESSEGE